MKALIPLLLCLMAAVGNAFYAWGQRKSVGLANSLKVFAGGAGLAAQSRTRVVA